jgi:acetyl-CoA acetyltransferase
MAVAYTRWLERHGQSREKMATLAVTQRRHTHLNPHAYFYKVPLTREDYLQLADGRLPVLSSTTATSPCRARSPSC